MIHADDVERLGSSSSRFAGGAARPFAVAAAGRAAGGRAVTAGEGGGTAAPHQGHATGFSPAGTLNVCAQAAQVRWEDIKSSLIPRPRRVNIPALFEGTDFM
jgi:hypothetical protein